MLKKLSVLDFDNQKKLVQEEAENAEDCKQTHKKGSVLNMKSAEMTSLTFITPAVAFQVYYID